MQQRTGQVDLELIGERIVKLAELSMLEHLDLLACSQAEGLLTVIERSEAAADQGTESHGW